MFKLHKLHLEYLKQAIEAYGHAYMHGDGNIYRDKTGVEDKFQPSYIAKEFAAAGNEGASYVIKFTNVSQVPKTIEDLEKMFVEAKTKEKLNSQKGKEIADSDFLPPLKKDEKKELSDEEKLQAEIDAEEKSKKGKK